MPNIQIRDVPPDVHERLKAQAAAAGQSLNEFLLATVTDRANTMTLAEFVADTRRQGVRKSPSTAEIVAIIREDRDRGH